MVTTTLALSALVIAVLGFFLTQQISDGLLLNKEKSATAQVSQGLTVAESNANLNKKPTTAAIANNYLYPTAQELQDASGNNSSYIVVIEVSADQVKSPVYIAGVAGGADPGAILCRREVHEPDQHPVGPVRQRAGRTDARRDQQGLLRADDDRVHPRPR